MKRKSLLLWQYLKALFKKWILWIFLILDVISFLIAYINQSLVIPNFIYYMLAMIGFFIAGFMVYEEVENQLESSPFYSIKASFNKVKGAMPKLIDEMKTDVCNNENTREFFILSRKWVFNYRGTFLAYYLEEHENLEGKMQVLENNSFVIDITQGKLAKHYRMTEEFVTLLKSM